MTNLQILNNSIRTLDGLYSLNDLHTASGENPSHRPSNFIRNEQTKELIAEIDRENSGSSKMSFKTLRGRNVQGTYACEELVLAYATWISPKFHLIVLRAFLAMHKGERLPQQLTLPEPEPTLEVEINLFCTLVYYANKARKFADEVEFKHRQLFELLNLPRYIKNDIAAEAYGIGKEFNAWIDKANVIAEKHRKPSRNLIGR